MSNYHFDYSQTMMMKIPLANPDNKGGSTVYNTFEETLELIKQMDNLTIGAPKIIYLVGWQNLGHDDKYPAFFNVNEHLKSATDETARDSLLWLISEAKNYNTTLSLHINLSDAYENSQLWDEYLENDLIILKASGKPKVTGIWNGRTAYAVNLKNEYESGYFQKRVDRLLKLLPIEELGTIHVDAFFANKGKGVRVAEEKKYRKKMVQYFMDRGIDVTSEFIYREKGIGYRSLWGKSDCIGVFPAIWNLRQNQKDFLKYPANVLAGGRLAEGLMNDMDLQYLFYGNMHAEEYLCSNEQMDSFNPQWDKNFLKDFATQSAPYFFLNQNKRLSVRGRGKGRTAHFSNGVETKIQDQQIIQNGNVLKENETICIPIHWKKDTYFAYSKKGRIMEFPLHGEVAQLYKVTVNGNEFFQNQKIVDNKITLQFEDDTAYEIKVKEVAE